MDIKTDEQLRTENEKKIQNYTFMSDVMMKVAFRDDLPFA